MRLLLLGIALGAVTVARAQMTLSGQVLSSPPGTFLVVNVPYDCWYYPANSVEIKTDAQGQFSLEVPVTKPQTIFLDYAGTRLHLYAEPGRSLSVRLNAQDSLKTTDFGGTLGQENELRRRLGLTFSRLEPQTWTDTLTAPDEILATIQQNQRAALGQLESTSSTLSGTFRRITAAEIRFFATSKLWDLIWKNGVWAGRNLSRHGQEAWRGTLVEAHRGLDLSDTLALESYHYQTTLAYYPRYLEYQAATREEFRQLAETIFKKPFAEVNQDVRQKGRRYWEYTALHYGLRGRALESALAAFLVHGIYQGDLEYLQEAYDDFTRRFPHSSYRAEVETHMKPYLASVAQAQQDMPGISFVPESPQVPSLDSILARHRGRVVYIDLWGTWCGPCRAEFAHNPKLKERFQGQPVDFVYVAVEHSPQPEKRWRETIAFYQLTGEHLLAGKELEKYLREMYAPTGTFQFPSYILVDKNGRIVTIQARRPSDQEALYQQIEQLL